MQTNVNSTTGMPSNNYYKGINTFSIGYSAGIIIDYNLTEKWSLQSGLLFKKSGDKSNYFEKDPRVGFIYQTSNVPRFGPVSFKFKYYGIELPLNINYFILEKTSLKIGGSFLYNTYATMQENYKYSGKLDAILTTYTAINFSGNFGVDYSLTQKLNIGIYSQFQFTETFEGNFNTVDTPRNYVSLGVNIDYKFF